MPEHHPSGPTDALPLDTEVHKDGLEYVKYMFVVTMQTNSLTNLWPDADILSTLGRRKSNGRGVCLPDSSWNGAIKPPLKRNVIY